MLTTSTKNVVASKYSASTGVTGLAKTIADLAKSIVNDAKVTNKGTQVRDNGNGGIETYEVDLPGTALPVATSTDIIIEAIAYAVVATIYDDIKSNMELKGGTVTSASLPYTVPLTGIGGGVPGPVIIPPASLAITGGTVTIAEGNFK